MTPPVNRKQSGNAVAASSAVIEGGNKVAFSLASFNFQTIILALLGLVFYANTFRHEIAFDDRMAIASNEYVHRGVAGIPDILSHDSYQSYLEQRGGGNQLAGGRYRPLSLITFAIEQQFLGTVDETDSDARDAIIAEQMHGRHVVNVLLYLLSVIALLHLFRKVVFPAQPLAAFVAALLFLVHPLHTEVVANVKSRDEIFSVLFITLTFIKAFEYNITKRKQTLLMACTYFFLALLSKEYAITLIVLLPLSLYIFSGNSAKQSFTAFLPLLIPFALYLLMRFAATSGPAEGAELNIMNNPYLYATAAQGIATKVLVLLNYVGMLFFPYRLAADYSYSQMAYTSFGNPLVWCSLALHLALVVAAILLIRRKHVLGFAIALYLLHLFLVSNLVVNIGAPMGERLIYHSSIGFVIAIAWVLVTVAQRAGSARVSHTALAALLIVVVVLSGYKTIDRNRDWKNDNTLFLTDVNTVPNSVLVNNNAAAACMAYAKQQKGNKAEMEQWFEKAIMYFDKVTSINPHHMNARLNRGLCYFNMGKPYMAYPDWDWVRRNEPSHPRVEHFMTALGQYYFNKGMAYGKANKADSAAWAFRQGALATPKAADMWYNLAYACASCGRYDEAKQALSESLQLAPNKTEAKQLYAQLGGMKGGK